VKTSPSLVFALACALAPLSATAQGPGANIDDIKNQAPGVFGEVSLAVIPARASARTRNPDR
jgi:hypothetical protein